MSAVEPVDSQAGAQQELPFAMVYGQAVMEMPLDLYIPPDALEVFLEAFEGPLDLLLYLIRKQNINILDIPVAEITRQYMGYVELMQSVRLELAAEYLVMAAMLAEIKSRMLLPRAETVEDEEEDPRAELIRRLQEYERFKAAAEGIDGLSRVGRDVVVPKLDAPEARARKLLPDVRLSEIAAVHGRGAAPRRHVRKPPGQPRGAVHPRTHERCAGTAQGRRFCAVRRAVHRRGRASGGGRDLYGDPRTGQGILGRAGAE